MLAGQQEKPLRFLVVGAGAVGGFVTARLADAGYDATVLVRQRRAAPLRDEGLRIASRDRTSVLGPTVVTAGELTSGYDAIVLAVKSDDLEGAMADIEPAVKPPAVIIPFLNGMAHVEPLTGQFGSAVLGGVLRIATELEDDGTIQVLAPTFEVELGELDGSPSARVDRLASAFRDAGAHVVVPGNIVDAMWAKWVFIASLGAVTSLMRATVGDIVAVPGGQRFARSVLAEAAAAAAACGHGSRRAVARDRGRRHRGGVADHIVTDTGPDRLSPHRSRSGAGRPRRSRPRRRKRHPASGPGRAGPAHPQPTHRILSRTAPETPSTWPFAEVIAPRSVRSE